jgi:hypothetical protein
MKKFRIEVTVAAEDIGRANAVHRQIDDRGTAINANLDIAAGVEVGPLVEIETCQLVGIRDGREVDLGDIPLTPELKAREIVRSYGLGDPDDEWSEASMMLGAMQELLNWMKQQGKLK